MYMNFPLSNLYQKVAISKWQEAEFTGYFKATQIKKCFNPLYETCYQQTFLWLVISSFSRYMSLEQAYSCPNHSLCFIICPQIINNISLGYLKHRMTNIFHSTVNKTQPYSFMLYLA